MLKISLQLLPMQRTSKVGNLQSYFDLLSKSLLADGYNLCWGPSGDPERNEVWFSKPKLKLF
jgi:hypothetical protein